VNRKSEPAASAPSKFEVLKRLFRRLWALEDELKVNDAIVERMKERIPRLKADIAGLEAQLSELLK
jgi:hypothetical protein